MGDHKDLTSNAAIEEMKKIAKNEVTMFCTFAANGDMKTRPMSTSAIDDDGTLWFMSPSTSDKNQELAGNPKVHLIYAGHGSSQYLAVDGRATISRDRAKIEQLWNPLAKAWFTEGKDDPRITLLRVTPEGGYYWDTKHGKMVALVSIAVAAVTGKPGDDGIEGKIRP